MTNPAILWPAILAPAVPGPELVVRGRRILTTAGVVAASVHVRDGRITAIGDVDDVPAGADEVVDAGPLVVLPGLVDTHVHVNEPGRSDWEGFVTATRAAAAGGVTTIVDMPLNSVPPTTTVAALEAKRAAAEGGCLVDVGFWGGAVPGNLGDLEDLADAGVYGFKAFLTDSGVDEFGHLDRDQLGEVMALLAGGDLVTLVHAEDARVLAGAPANGDPRRYATYLASRPDAAEVAAVADVVALSRATGARAHVLHLSSAEALACLQDAPSRVTAETCPHYLALAAEDVPVGATVYKCAPPIRGRSNRDRLWGALDKATVSMVVSDHSPCPPAMKLAGSGDFLAAWGGIASLQLGLAVVWTHARSRGHDLVDVARWMAAAPAELAGLADKGRIAVGARADLVLFDPDAQWTVEPELLEHRHPLTPYAGHRLTGRVEGTWVGGTRVYPFGDASPAGRLLRRSAGGESPE